MVLKTLAETCPRCHSDNVLELYDDSDCCENEYAGSKCLDCKYFYDNTETEEYVSEDGIDEMNTVNAHHGIE